MKAKAVLCVLIAASWAMVAWLWVRSSRQGEQIRSLDRQLAVARAKVSVPPAPVVVSPPADSRPKQAASSRTEREEPATPVVDPEIETLRARIQESAANFAKAQARITELESQVLTVMGERARVSSAADEARAQVAELTRTVDSMNADRAADEKRIRELQSEISGLRDQVSAGSQRSSQMGQLTSELRDITRRQQVCVNNILRRYREVTGMFRTLPGMMESKGSDPEVSRIQTAMSMADEDVRQLNDLSTRLGRLEKRIAARP